MFRTVIRHVVIDDQFIDSAYAFAVIEPVFMAMETGDPEAYERSLRHFSDGQVQLTAVHWHTSEVCNGGHYQFYTNSTGIVWPEALAGYRSIGIVAVAEILREAADRYGGDISRDRDIREAQIDAGGDDLSDLDNRFSKLRRQVRSNKR
jgi:hypothetical protein